MISVGPVTTPPALFTFVEFVPVPLELFQRRKPPTPAAKSSTNTTPTAISTPALLFEAGNGAATCAGGAGVGLATCGTVRLDAIAADSATVAAGISGFAGTDGGFAGS